MNRGAPPWQRKPAFAVPKAAATDKEARLRLWCCGATDEAVSRATVESLHWTGARTAMIATLLATEKVKRGL